MPESLFMENLRKKVVEAVDREMNRSQAAYLFGVGLSSSNVTPEHGSFHRQLRARTTEPSRWMSLCSSTGPISPMV
jgi:hypothetical protein